MRGPQQKARFVFDGRFLAKPTGGVSRVGRELLRALADEAAESGASLNARLAVPTGADVGGIGVDALGGCARGFASQLGVQLGFPLLYRGTTVVSPCNVTPLLARNAVVWIHDAHVFDAPESYPVAYRLWHRGMLAGARLRGFRVATVSKYARDRLVSRGLDAGLTHVVYNGGDHILREAEEPDIMTARRLEPGRFILIVGSPAKHKNVPFAVRALLNGLDRSARLAIVGLAQAGPYAEAGELPADERVVVLPRLTDGQLRALYANASAVVCPSLCEGFGLYAAEAMFAESGPLVLARRASLPEVGGDAALYFDPQDEASLRAAVAQATRADCASRLRDAALRQREQFRWRSAARQVIRTFLADAS